MSLPLHKFPRAVNMFFRMQLTKSRFRFPIATSAGVFAAWFTRNTWLYSEIPFSLVNLRESRAAGFPSPS